MQSTASKQRIRFIGYPLFLWKTFNHLPARPGFRHERGKGFRYSFKHFLTPFPAIKKQDRLLKSVLLFYAAGLDAADTASVTPYTVETLKQKEILKRYQP